MNKLFQNFKNTVINEKTISVWGLGYLGYTTVLQLQNYGFKCNVHDESLYRLKSIKSGNYPTEYQKESWSLSKNIPPFKLEKINIIFNPEKMFKKKFPVHIIAFPNEANQFEKSNRYIKTAKTFNEYSQDLDYEILVIFLSASYPGSIEKLFIGNLKHKNKIKVVSAFRSDWTIETFLSNSHHPTIAANNENDLKYAEYFYNLLDTKTEKLISIKTAEFYENTKNVIEWSCNSIINQLMFAFPDIDMRLIMDKIIKNVDLNNLFVKISSGGYKYPMSIKNIFQTAKYPNVLSILKEIESSNFSEILNFVEFAKRNKLSTATVLGITYQSNKKSLDLSPSVILSESLFKAGFSVYLNDPLYTEEELKELFPNFKYFNYSDNKFNSEIIFIMTGHREYKYLTQTDVNNADFSNLKYIIDNEGIWKHLSFPNNVKYYAVGSGKLDVFM